MIPRETESGGRLPGEEGGGEGAGVQLAQSFRWERSEGSTSQDCPPGAEREPARKRKAWEYRWKNAGSAFKTLGPSDENQP